ncbi:hypothetical protein BATDEDRAFT_22550 [Batrachochytrium dendrobatidis JAM81]|uniref:Cell division control protein n=1 Tax=Batrachochytrium dendrobatidis (strain JAM81 / FGSC 10211) TaxID=684364 RepID=F4NV49_BATDJ|nr:AAA family ATPase CDC6 [Batrachochytrium dendrobatidis JAM81]EGF84473.1 hypothetical protein BATDEDRAFT_22550 [Batrachochytrium dendrobatidis JAM81]|eukprot:XP_006675594.1 hypothetical protein BATDEDRAFT_22550 [Batrachochytrium dendrobatidis JAM81]
MVTRNTLKRTADQSESNVSTIGTPSKRRYSDSEDNCQEAVATPTRRSARISAINTSSNTKKNKTVSIIAPKISSSISASILNDALPKPNEPVPSEPSTAQQNTPSKSGRHLISDSKTPKTPSTSTKKLESVYTPKGSGSIFQGAKAAFRRCSTPSRLVGRERERNIVQQFLLDNPFSCKSGSLYISGLPGTGKTALLEECIRNYASNASKLSFPLKIVKVNCMSISEPKGIYTSILSQLGLSGHSISEGCKVLENVFLPETKSLTKKSPFHLLILDEIDQLAVSNQDILYQLFTWANHADSRLSLIGISNTVDLTYRLLPRLRTKNCEPQLLNFDPYKVSEITEIIRNRLDMVSNSPIGTTIFSENNPPSTPCRSRGSNLMSPDTTTISLMQPMAIELAARKIAETGDIRKALDVCRTAIELAETEEKQRQVVDEQVKTSKQLDTSMPPISDAMKSSGKNSLIASTPTKLAVPKVTVRHILSATTNLFGSPNTNRVTGLSMQLKLLLCTLLIMKRTLNADMSIDKVLETYLLLCRYRNQVNPLKRTEFMDLLTNLEAQGLIRIASGKGKEMRHVKLVSMTVRPEDIELAVSAVPILTTVLENASLALASTK